MERRDAAIRRALSLENREASRPLWFWFQIRAVLTDPDGTECLRRIFGDLRIIPNALMLPFTMNFVATPRFGSAENRWSAALPTDRHRLDFWQEAARLVPLLRLVAPAPPDHIITGPIRRLPLELLEIICQDLSIFDAITMAISIPARIGAALRLRIQRRIAFVKAVARDDGGWSLKVRDVNGHWTETRTEATMLILSGIQIPAMRLLAGNLGPERRLPIISEEVRTSRLFLEIHPVHDIREQIATLRPDWIWTRCYRDISRTVINREVPVFIEMISTAAQADMMRYWIIPRLAFQELPAPEEAGLLRESVITLLARYQYEWFHRIRDIETVYVRLNGPISYEHWIVLTDNAAIQRLNAASDAIFAMTRDGGEQLLISQPTPQTILMQSRGATTRFIRKHAGHLLDTYDEFTI
ncbi:unnamed protein product, partial [Mesorhabditis spiculigera]